MQYFKKDNFLVINKDINIRKGWSEDALSSVLLKKQAMSQGLVGGSKISFRPHDHTC